MEKINWKEFYWKIGITIALGILLFVFFAPSTQAIDFGFPKNVTCGLFNISGFDCDLFWCESINEGNYSLTKELCVFEINNSIIINKTIIINDTIIFIPENSVSDIDFYNKTEIQGIIYNKSAIDEFLNALKINFSQVFAKAEDLVKVQQDVKSADKSSGGLLDDISGQDILLGLGGIALLLYGLKNWSDRQKEKNPLEKGEAHVVQSKIKSQREMELEGKLLESEQKNQETPKEIPKTQETPKEETNGKNLKIIEQLKKDISVIEEKLKKKVD